MASEWDIDRILHTIRQRESSGDYTARNPSSSASGAYQFIDSTWRAVGGATYAPRAYLATPAQQDTVARSYVEKILAANRDNLRAVAVTWYVGDPNKPDSYKPPGPGNTLTVGQYWERWRATYNATLKAGSTFDKVKDLPGKAADAVAGQVTEALGNLSQPFLEGLRKIAIIGVTVAAGMALVVAGAWRGVRSSG